MADLEMEKLEKLLNERMKDFITDRCAATGPYLDAIQRFRHLRGNVFLCGGAVRDLLLSNKFIPRDLDIILGPWLDLDHIADLFADHHVRKNCYGGLSIRVEQHSVDVWLLYKTWAYEKSFVEVRDFIDYPKTTFLNVDAIAVELFSFKQQKRRIYEKGFFDAILNKTIEINLEENANPPVAVARAINIARKFRFAIGPKLAKYIVYFAKKTGCDELFNLYMRRYNPVHFSIECLDSYIKVLNEHLRTYKNSLAIFPLPDKQEYNQKLLWR
jgi:hypothetical protein